MSCSTTNGIGVPDRQVFSAQILVDNRYRASRVIDRTHILHRVVGLKRSSTSLHRHCCETGGVGRRPAAERRVLAKRLRLVAIVVALLAAVLGLTAVAASVSPVKRSQTYVAATEPRGSQLLGPIGTGRLRVAAPFSNPGVLESPLARGEPRLALIGNSSCLSFLSREHAEWDHGEPICHGYDHPTTSARRPDHAYDLAPHNTLARAGVEFGVMAIATDHPSRAPPAKGCVLARRRLAAEDGSGELSEAFHYTGSQNVASIEANGLRAGSYATPDGELSPLQAQIDLALPPNRGLPGGLIRIDLAGLRQAGYDIPDVTQVGRSYSMPGGGYEMQFPYPIPPEFLKVIAP